MISRNAIFYLMILGALVLVLFAGGAMPLIVQIFTVIFQVIGSLLLGLIHLIRH